MSDREMSATQFPKAYQSNISEAYTPRAPLMPHLGLARPRHSPGHHQLGCGSPIPGQSPGGKSILSPEAIAHIKDKFSGSEGDGASEPGLEEMIIQILIMSKGPKAAAKMMTPEARAAVKKGVKQLKHLTDAIGPGSDGEVDVSKIIDVVDRTLGDVLAHGGVKLPATPNLPADAQTTFGDVVTSLREKGVDVDSKGNSGVVEKLRSALGLDDPADDAPPPNLPADAQTTFNDVVTSLREKGVDVDSKGNSDVVEKLRSALGLDDPAGDAPPPQSGAAALRAAVAPRLDAMVEDAATSDLGRDIGFDEAAFRKGVEKKIEVYGAAIDRVREGKPLTVEQAAALVGGLENITGVENLRSSDGMPLDGFASGSGIMLDTALEGDPDALTSVLVEEIGERFFQTVSGETSTGDFGAEVLARTNGGVTGAAASTLRNDDQSGDTAIVDIDGVEVAGEADSATPQASPAAATAAPAETMTISFAARAPSDPEVVVEYRNESGTWVQAASSKTGDTTASIPGGTSPSDIRMREIPNETLGAGLGGRVIYGSSGTDGGALMSYSGDNDMALTMGGGLSVTPGVAPTGFAVAIQTSINSPDVDSPEGMFNFLSGFDAESSLDGAPDGVLDESELMAAGISEGDAKRLVRAYGGASTGADGQRGISISDVAGEPGLGLSAMTLDMKADPAASLFGFTFNPVDRTLTPLPINTRHMNTYAKASAVIHSVMDQRENGGLSVPVTFADVANGGMTQAEFKTAMVEIFGESALLDDASVQALFTNFSNSEGLLTQDGLVEAFDRGAISLSADDPIAGDAPPIATIDASILPAGAGISGDTSNTRYQGNGFRYYSDVAIPESILDGTGPTDGLYDPPYAGDRQIAVGVVNKNKIKASDMTRSVDADGQVTWKIRTGANSTEIKVEADGQEDRYLSDYQETMTAEGSADHLFKNARSSGETTADDGSVVELWTPREFQFRNAGRNGRALVSLDTPTITVTPPGGGKPMAVAASDITSVDVVHVPEAGAQAVYAITVKMPDGSTATVAHQPKTVAEADFYKNLYAAVTGEPAPIAPGAVTAQSSADQIADLPQDVQTAVLSAMSPEQLDQVLDPYIEAETEEAEATPETDAEFEDIVSEFDDPPPPGLSLGQQAQHFADIAGDAASVPVSDDTLMEFLVDQETEIPDFEGGMVPYPLTAEENATIDALVDEVFPPGGASRSLQGETASFEVPEGMTKEQFIEFVKNATNASLAQVPPESRTPETFRIGFKAALAFTGAIGQGGVAIARGDIFGFNGLQRMLPLGRAAAAKAISLGKPLPPAVSKSMMAGLNVVGAATAGGYVMQVLRTGLESGLFDEAEVTDVLRKTFYDAGVPAGIAAAAITSLMQIAKGGPVDSELHVNVVPDEVANGGLWVAVVGFLAVDVLSGVGVWENGALQNIQAGTKDGDPVKVLEGFGDAAGFAASASRVGTGVLATILTGVANSGYFTEAATTRALDARKTWQVRGAWAAAGAGAVSGMFYTAAMGSTRSKPGNNGDGEPSQPVPNSTSVDPQDSPPAAPISRSQLGGAG